MYLLAIAKSKLSWQHVASGLFHFSNREGSRWSRREGGGYEPASAGVAGGTRAGQHVHADAASVCFLEAFSAQKGHKGESEERQATVTCIWHASLRHG
mmetsp:Transcript_15592/g.26842  ORF Transcript_15592/g.26842 Transcript_15592/m.26842 type:complete len:98 (+) Transcript_15592:476-769(+)